MSDGFDGLRAEFLAENEDTLLRLEQDLRSFGTAAGGPLPPDVLDRVFRTVHSLKGVAGMFGLDMMSSTAHSLENLLDGIREGRFAVDAGVAELLDRGGAALRALLAAADGDDTAARVQAQGVMEAVSDALRARLPAEESRGGTLAATLARLGPDEVADVRSAAAAGRTIAIVETELPEEGFENAFRDLLTAIRAWGSVHGTATTARDSERRTFQARTVASGETDAFALVRAVAPLGARVHLPDPVPGPVVAPVDEPAPDGTAARPRSPIAFLRVPAERVDRLLADLGEAVHARSRLEDDLARALKDANVDRLRATAVRQSLRELDRRLRILRDGVLGVRTVRLGPLFRRLESVFHEACRQTGKEARLVVEGGTTELDKSVAEALREPLVHLVRNAVDHGLEPADARASAGKDRCGTVRVVARADGSRAILEVTDDGRGVDFDGVLARARRLGLVGAEERPERSKLIDALFHPGLTVKDEATELSGRGVGLDVVRESIARLGGVLDLETGPGGTVFRLRIPTSLAILTALEVEAGGRAYYLPLPNVVRALEVAPHLVRREGGREFVTLDGETIATRDLAPHLPDTRERRPAVLVAAADRRALLWVDRLGRRRDVAVRSLGLGTVPGVAGCAETADGRIVLVLDPASLMDVEPTAAVAGS